MEVDRFEASVPTTSDTPACSGTIIGFVSSTDKQGHKILSTFSDTRVTFRRFCLEERKTQLLQHSEKANFKTTGNSCLMYTGCIIAWDFLTKKFDKRTRMHSTCEDQIDILRNIELDDKCRNQIISDEEFIILFCGFDKRGKPIAKKFTFTALRPTANVVNLSGETAVCLGSGGNFAQAKLRKLLIRPLSLESRKIALKAVILDAVEFAASQDPQCGMNCNFVELTDAYNNRTGFNGSLVSASFEIIKIWGTVVPGAQSGDVIREYFDLRTYGQPTEHPDNFYVGKLE